MSKPATFVIRSENRKTGPCSNTYAAQSTCPKSCPFRNGKGCYAELGHTGIITSRLNTAKKGALATIKYEVALMDAAPKYGAMDLRVHVVGDCPTPECASIMGSAMVRYEKRTGRQAWTYTHAWRDVPASAWQGANVLASCESASDVRHAQAMGYATAMVVPRGGKAPAGIKALPCLFEKKGIQCINCRLCLRAEPLRKAGVTIAFGAHGVMFKTVERVLAAKSAE